MNFNMIYDDICILKSIFFFILQYCIYGFFSLLKDVIFLCDFENFTTKANNKIFVFFITKYKIKGFCG